MIYLTEGFHPGKRRFPNSRMIPLVLAVCSLGLTGCGKLSTVLGGLGVREVQARTSEGDIDAYLTYREALIGRNSDAVVELFGKPQGVFQKQHGRVWMYSRWCVKFDDQGLVVALERDVAATGIGGGASAPSMALAPGPIAPATQPAPTSEGVTRISNGGHSVDLDSLMSTGKITVVDFYADWCGPCRRIGPSLEKLASENPDVVVVKVDIVKWGSPVARQYNIKSVPNIRVFDPHGQPLGQPTHSLSEVRASIEQARG